MRGMTEDRLTWHFENWAYWQRDIASDYGEGYSYKDGSGACSNASKAFDSIVDGVDRRCADAVSAILESVTPAEFGAVRHMHMEAVWRFGRKTLEELYASARAKVNLGLLRRGID